MALSVLGLNRAGAHCSIMEVFSYHKKNRPLLEQISN